MPDHLVQPVRQDPEVKMALPEHLVRQEEQGPLDLLDHRDQQEIGVTLDHKVHLELTDGQVIHYAHN